MGLYLDISGRLNRLDMPRGTMQAPSFQKVSVNFDDYGGVTNDIIEVGIDLRRGVSPLDQVLAVYGDSSSDVDPFTLPAVRLSCVDTQWTLDLNVYLTGVNKGIPGARILWYMWPLFTKGHQFVLTNYDYQPGDVVTMYFLNFYAPTFQGFGFP